MSAVMDSRVVQPGDVFYALPGEQRDGHEFVEAALAAGAAAAVIARARAGQFPAPLASRLRVVEDPLRALQADAQAARRAWGGPLVAITGSAGKTTTKEMIAAVLASELIGAGPGVAAPRHPLDARPGRGPREPQPGPRVLRVLKNEGNYNNHLGVPLTLLRLQPEHEVAVVEMGMNHAGEIAALAAIAEPTVGVFTNVGSAHLGNFDSIDGIAEAKRELARAIPETGTLVLNRDDARVARFGEGFGGRVVMYSAAEFTGTLQLAGEHNRANAAAAMAVGGLFGVNKQAAQQALAAMMPMAGRGEIVQYNGITIIQDCYNANPEAMLRMLAVLAATPARRHVAVLGEMRELGAAGGRLHREVGRAAAAANLDALWAVGGEAEQILEGARAAGFLGPTQFCASAAEAAAQLRPYLRAGDAALFKASHVIHLEEAVDALRRG